ncbi:MAG TPA: hypothetical protein VH643_06065 [Gemmataceae bacterium]|jgi:hypothetical protein
MNSQLRPAIVAVALGLLAVCVFGLRLACTPADLSALHRNEELEQLREATFHRVGARQRMVRELIDRRRSLAQALERFEELDRDWPDFSPQAAEERAGRSEDEWAYQHILVIVRESLRDRPEEAAAVLRRLEKDYRQLQADGQTPSTGAMERTEQSR